MTATLTTPTTVQRTHLLGALNQVLPALGRRDSLPVLACVHLHQHQGTMTVTATDLDLRVACTIPADGPDLEVIVGARTFRNLIREAAGPLALTATDGELDIRWARTDAQLKTIDLDEWPRPPVVEGDPVKVPAGDLQVMARVANFASNDQARPILTGLRIGRGEAVCTDSYRLAVGNIETNLGGDRVLLLQARVVRFLPTLLATEDATLTTDGRHCRIDVGELTITSVLIDGDFPPYERLIPKAVPHRATVNRTGLAAAVKAAMAVAGDATPVRLNPDGPNLEVVIVQQDVGQVHTLVDATFQGGPPPSTAAFNPRYLLDLLGTLDGDQVALEITDHLKPVVIREEPYTLLIMPVRVS